MTQHILLTLLLALPFAGFFTSLLLPKRERLIFSVALSTIMAGLVLLAWLALGLLVSGDAGVSATFGTLQLGDYAFRLTAYFDWLGALFLAMTLVITALVFIFGRYYMHRERGFKRFFTTTLLFFVGLSLIILGGNFEMLFVGWEIIGISSVLLIAFYRDRFLPARNALKVFSVYRIADAFLIAAIWYAHHIFHQSVGFADLSEIAAHHGGDLVILGLLLLGAALIKSAQFPFSYWLPRAMEGPTTSSAIFYGALSVHMGLFLLLRTAPLWENSLTISLLIGAFGLVTALVATSIARVQSTTKTQIAYASIAQIGIMFIEVALGLYWLALFHFVSNALLRTYQLLISPSIVGYLIHDQFFNFVQPAQKIRHSLLGKLRATLYVLGVREWNLHALAGSYMWGGVKRAGRHLGFLDRPLISGAVLLGLTVLLLALGFSMVAAVMLAVAAIAYAARSFTVKASALLSWNSLLLGSVCVGAFLATATNSWGYFALYIVPIVLAYAAGVVLLWYLQKQHEHITLAGYHGITHTHRRLSHAFFVLVLLVMAFPLSTTFLAQDVLLSLVPLHHGVLVGLFAVAYVIMGVSAMRLYTKLFFGAHPTNHHEKALRYS